jgi:hypothetical protein
MHLYKYVLSRIIIIIIIIIRQHVSITPVAIIRLSYNTNISITPVAIIRVSYYINTINIQIILEKIMIKPLDVKLLQVYQVNWSNKHKTI